MIHLDEFVCASEIDPVFYDRTYYAGSRDDEDAFRLLHEALRKTERAGIGRFSFHDREYLAALRAGDGVLILHTLRFDDEVVWGRTWSSTCELPRSRPSAEIEMAARLIDSLSEDFKPRVVRRRVPPGGSRPDQAQGEGGGD